MATLKKTEKLVFKTNYLLMQVNSIAEYSAILLTFIKLPIVIKIFVLSIFEWLFYTGFTIPRITFWYHKVCRVMTNGYREGQTVLSTHHTNDILLTFQFCIFYLK